MLCRVKNILSNGVLGIKRYIDKVLICSNNPPSFYGTKIARREGVRKSNIYDLITNALLFFNSLQKTHNKCKYRN